MSGSPRPGFARRGGEAAFLNLLKGSAYGRLSNYDLSVIPLFLLMGQFATQGGLSRALFSFANALIGHLRGGIALASVAAGGTLGIRIPPSVVLVVYAILAEQNIANLFAAAMIPGLIAATLYLIAIAIYVRRRAGAGARPPRA